MTTEEQTNQVQPESVLVQVQSFYQTWKKTILISSSSIGVAVLVLIVIWTNVFGLFAGPQPNLVYEKDNELYFRAYDGEKSVQLSDEFFDEQSEQTLATSLLTLDRLVKFDAEQEKAFYLTEYNGSKNSGNLYVYLINGDGDESDKNVQIASNVTSFTISSDGSYVAYTKETGNGETKAYLYDFQDEQLLGRNLSSIQFASDNSKVVYCVNDAAGNDGSEYDEYDLYEQQLTGEKQKQKLESNIAAVVSVSDDLKQIYYSKMHKEDEMLTLYTFDEKNQEQKIADDFGTLESKITDGKFYYLKAKVTDVNLYDLVKDEFVESDKSIGTLAPVEPILSNYTKVEQQYDYFAEEYYSYETYDYDAYNVAYEQYRDAAYAYADLVQEVQARNELREKLKGYTYPLVHKTLYYYDGKKEQKVEENVNEIFSADAEAQFAAFSKTSGDVPQTVNIQDIDSTEDVYSLFEDNDAPTDKLFASVALKESELLLSNFIEDAQFTVDYTNNYIYAIERNKEEDTFGELVRYTIGEQKITGKKKLDDDVVSFELSDEADTIHYFKDEDDGSADLYTIAEDKTVKVASDVYLNSLVVSNDGKTVSYIGDYESEDRSGTLYIVEDGEKSKIADEVGYYYFNDANYIYYVGHYDAEDREGDLYLYQGEGEDNTVLIDNNVTEIYSDLQ